MKRRQELSELKVYYGRVLRTQRVTPLMQRITLGGMDVPVFQSIGPEDFVYLFFPKPDARSVPPVANTFTWAQARDMAPEDRPVGRYYTVRAHRNDPPELDIDMVLHGDGPGATYARDARPGDVVSFWGPRFAYDPPEQVESLLLIADLTGLPATAAILASLPAGQDVQAFIEVPDASEEQPLPTAADARVTWVHRGDTPAGKSNVLVDAVSRACLPAAGVYVYGAGEYRVMREIRRHLAGERGYPAQSISLLNYWRHDDHPYEGDE